MKSQYVSRAAGQALEAAKANLTLYVRRNIEQYFHLRETAQEAIAAGAQAYIPKPDVEALIDRGLVDSKRLAEYFEAVAPNLYRFPAIDPADVEALTTCVDYVIERL